MTRHAQIIVTESPGSQGLAQAGHSGHGRVRDANFALNQQKGSGETLLGMCVECGSPDLDVVRNSEAILTAERTNQPWDPLADSELTCGTGLTLRTSGYPLSLFPFDPYAKHLWH